jgi:hypothetical protein
VILGRRIAIPVGIFATILVLGAVSVWLSLPTLIAREVAAKAERRGLSCTVTAIRVSFDEVLFENIEFRDPGGAVEASFDEVLLDSGPISLAIDGIAALRTVMIRGGRVRIDSGVEEFESLLSRERPRDGQSEVQDARAIPAIHLEGVSFDLRDETGTLFSAEALEIVASDGRVAGTCRGVTAGTHPDDSIRIGTAEFSGSVRERVVDRLEMREIAIDVAEAESQRPFADRLAALRRKLGDSANGAQVQEGRESTHVLPFLGESFSAKISGLAVRKRTPQGTRDLLTELDCEVRREGTEALRTLGQGQPDLGGRLRWNLLVEPSELRVTGDLELERVALAIFEPILPKELPLHRPEDARLDGSLQIVSHGETLEGNGRLAVRDLAIFSPRIAPDPIAAIALEIEGAAKFWPEHRRLEITRLELDSGAASVAIVGALEWADDHYLMDLDARLPMTPCGDAISAIPRDLLQELSGFSIRGNLAGSVLAHIDSRDLDSTVLSIQIADGCEFEAVPTLADLTRFRGPFLHRVEEPDGTAFEMTTGPGTEAWTSIHEISPFMLHAVLGHEDAGFFRHAGFSTLSIREALVRNLREGRYVMGASTISMQLVKNVFLRRQKTLARKVQEVLLTWWIESAWPKEAILELYLNVIEYGPSVYGIRNAAMHYFGVLPADLSPAQAAYLASILPNPRRYHVHWDEGTLPSAWVGRISRFLRILGDRGRFDPTAVEEGIAELPVLRFHRPERPIPEPREFAGRTAELPFQSTIGDADMTWDEALDGEVIAHDESISDP